MTTRWATCLISAAGGGGRARGEIAQRLGAFAQRAGEPAARLGQLARRRVADEAGEIVLQVPAQVVDQPVDVGGERSVAGDSDRRPLAGHDAGQRQRRVVGGDRDAQVGRKRRRFGLAIRPGPGENGNANGPIAGSSDGQPASSICIVRAASLLFERRRLGRDDVIDEEHEPLHHRALGERFHRFEHGGIVGTRLARDRAAGGKRRRGAPLAGESPLASRPHMILLTGATGYIASHTWLALEAAGYAVAGIDDFSNSSSEVLRRLAALGADVSRFRRTDVRDRGALDACSLPADRGGGPFAALKAVGESVAQPLAYYANNVGGTVASAEAMQAHGCRTIVFSSSATVYGEPERLPIGEDSPLSATSPYGATKLICEGILRDLERSDPAWRIALLRYFNPVGAHESGTIGEEPRGTPNNLMPYVAQVAVGKREKLQAFGGDYETPDGTGVRDYLHVMDLAEGHVAAMRHLLGGAGFADDQSRHGARLERARAGARVRARQRAARSRTGSRRAVRAISPPAMPTRRWPPETIGWRAKRDLDAMCVDSWRWQMGQSERLRELRRRPARRAARGKALRAAPAGAPAATKACRPSPRRASHSSRNGTAPCSGDSRIRPENSTLASQAAPSSSRASSSACRVMTSVRLGPPARVAQHRQQLVAACRAWSGGRAPATSPASQAACRRRKRDARRLEHGGADRAPGGRIGGCGARQPSSSSAATALRRGADGSGLNGAAHRLPAPGRG